MKVLVAFRGGLDVALSDEGLVKRSDGASLTRRLEMISDRVIDSDVTLKRS